MKKKILSLMLAMVMMLSLSVTALASTTGVESGDTTWTGEGKYGTEDAKTDTYSDATAVSFEKIFKLIGDGISPAETFTFSIEKDTNNALNVDEDLYRTDGPNLSASSDSSNSTNTVEFTEGAAKTAGATSTLTITLPAVDPDDTTGICFPGVGIYVYKITEIVPDTDNSETIDAGVEYNIGNSTYYLKVTVITNDDGEYVRIVAIYNSNNEKVDGTDGGDIASFENTYTANTLTVTKNVTGNLGDTDAEFEFTITFSYVGSTINFDPEVITISSDGVEGSWDDDHLVYTVSLTNSDSVIFENIPEGVTYTVVETVANDDGYETTVTSTNSSDTIDNADGSAEGTMGEEEVTVVVENEREDTVDTGISLDSLPYILMLIVVAAGVVVMISRRRLDNRF